jgi:hypothetical protein
MAIKDRAKMTLAAVVAAASLGLTGPAALAHADAPSASKGSASHAVQAHKAASSVRIFHVRVGCDKVRVHHHHTVGRVFGHGRGWTKRHAVAAAWRHAQQNAGRGFRAVRCRVTRVN